MRNYLGKNDFIEKEYIKMELLSIKYHLSPKSELFEAKYWLEIMYKIWIWRKIIPLSLNITLPLNSKNFIERHWRFICARTVGQTVNIYLLRWKVKSFALRSCHQEAPVVRSTKSKHFVTAKVELLGNNDNNDDGTLTSDVELFFKGIDYCSHYYKSLRQ